MSDTPRTDKHCEYYLTDSKGGRRNFPKTWVPAEFARELERELNELLRLLKVANEAVVYSEGVGLTYFIDYNGSSPDSVAINERLAQ